VKGPNPQFASAGVTIFETMSRLAIEHRAVNLGQGFPDTDGPEDILRLASQALLAGPNQYPPMLGLPELREAVAEHDRRFYGLEYDPRTEVLVTSGATEALADCLMALTEPGDEVVLFEPLYDSYLPMVRRAGAVPRLVRLSPPDWTLDPAALEAAFSERTKAVLLNNPLNPAAKVFRAAELEMIAEQVRWRGAYVIADEVYEHIVFDGARHCPMAGLAGMRERTLKIGSAGKTFSLTGWKVGYVTGPERLVGVVAKAHQFVTFTTPPHLQRAVAAGLAKGDGYYADLAGSLAAKRDRLGAGLRALGLPVLPTEGTYFLAAGVQDLGLGDDDLEVCRRLTLEAGVTAVPMSAFYEGEGPGGYLRFCFSKREAVLDEALARLSRFIATRRQH